MWKLLFFILFSSSLSCLEEKVMICGVARDVAKALPNMVKTIEALGSLFADYRVIVYENDSTDDTPKLLREWSLHNSKVFTYSEVTSNVKYINLTWDFAGYRPERVARARNIVLDYALSKEYDDFPYVIWIDMDFGKPFSFDGIIETFQSKQAWDAVFAYGIDQKGRYFDWFAFRDKKHPIGAELLGNRWWQAVDKEKNRFRLSKRSNWHPVYSAFGGLGIYKKDSIRNCRYDAVVTEDLKTVAEKLIRENPKNWFVKKYHVRNKALIHHLRIASPPAPGLPNVNPIEVGILLGDKVDSLIWRMNSGVTQFPTTCEHVPFHASMIVHGHDKLFINPRIVLNYDDR